MAGVALIAKFALCLILSVIFIFAIVFITLGAIQIWAFPRLLNELSKQLKPEDIAISNITQYEAVEKEIKNMISDIAVSVGKMFFTIGILLTIYCVLGKMYCCCNLSIIIIISIVYSIALAAVLGIYLIYFSNFGQDYIMDDLDKRYHPYIVGYQINGNTSSMVVDVIQIKFKCCGSNSWKDFHNLKIQNRNVKMPPTCCGIDILKQGGQALQNCVMTPSSPFMDTGCMVKMQKDMQPVVNYVFIFFSIVFACLIIASILNVLILCV